MLFKKELVKSPTYLDQLDDANALIDYSDSAEELSLDETMKIRAKALEIYRGLYNGPHKEDLDRNPDFHATMGMLCGKMDLYLKPKNREPLFDMALLHLQAAADLYSYEGSHDLTAQMHKNQAALLNFKGESNKAAYHQKQADANTWLDKKQPENLVNTVDQDTEEFYRVTDEQLKEYDQAKKGQEREKKLSPRKMASVVMSKLVKKSNS
jgi:hypothetical protein